MSARILTPSWDRPCQDHQNQPPKVGGKRLFEVAGELVAAGVEPVEFGSELSGNATEGDLGGNRRDRERLAGYRGQGLTQPRCWLSSARTAGPSKRPPARGGRGW